MSSLWRSYFNATFIRQSSLIWGPLLSVLLLFLPVPETGVLTLRMAAVVVLMATWWITEVIPLPVTALLPIVLFPLLGIMDGDRTAGYYMNSIIFLFVGGFLIALAMEKWNLHKRIALTVLLKFSHSLGSFLFGLMLATAFISMWTSNTSTVMMLFPITLAVIVNLEESLGKKEVHRYAVGLLLGIMYASTIGGISTLIGTPTNLVFARLFQQQFPAEEAISFLRWLIVVLPVSALYFLLSWAWLRHRFCPKSADARVDRTSFERQLHELGPMSWEEKWVAGILAMMALLWIFRADIPIGAYVIPGWSNIFTEGRYINDGTVSIAMALILFFIPAKRRPGEISGEKGEKTAEYTSSDEKTPLYGKIMDWSAAPHIPWGIVLLFGGGFALAAGFTESGLAQWIATQFTVLKVLPPYVITLVICTAIVFISELASNVATAQMFLPVLGSLAIALGVPPLSILLPATLAASLGFMLPVGSPPNAIVFSSGRISVIEMVRTGFLINLLGAVLVATYMYFIGNYFFN